MPRVGVLGKLGIPTASGYFRNHRSGFRGADNRVVTPVKGPEQQGVQSIHHPTDGIRCSILRRELQFLEAPLRGERTAAADE